MNDTDTATAEAVLVRLAQHYATKWGEQGATPEQGAALVAANWEFIKAEAVKLYVAVKTA